MDLAAPSNAASGSEALPPTPDLPPDPPPLVVVGASGAEGMRQLVALVAALPAGLPAAVLVVLHRPVDRRSFLPEILARASRLHVVVPARGEDLRSGVCYVADLDHHLSVGPGGTAELVPDHRYRNRTVDLLFQEAAKHARGKVIGVVLAGSLSDGAAGIAAIRRAGGAAMVLDANPGGRGGMPRAARRAAPDARVAHDPIELAASVTAAVSTASRDR